MVSPDANSLGLSQQVAGFFNSFAGLEYVTDDDDLIHLLLAEAVESDAKELDLFVDVSDQAEFHSSSASRRTGRPCRK